MNIVVAGGRTKADFLIASLLGDRKNKVIAINDGSDYCEYLADKYGISVIEGDPTKKYTLDTAEIEKFDVCIALRPDDADNLAICQMAAKLYKIKKTVCTVSNPRNVELFKQLGVNHAISGTYMVAHMLEQVSTLDEIAKTMDFEDTTAVVSELFLKKGHAACGKAVRDLAFPSNVIIGCLIRKKKILIPNGDSILHEDDKIILITSRDIREEALRVLTGGEKNE